MPAVDSDGLTNAVLKEIWSADAILESHVDFWKIHMLLFMDNHGDLTKHTLNVHQNVVGVVGKNACEAHEYTYTYTIEQIFNYCLAFVRSRS